MRVLLLAALCGLFACGPVHHHQPASTNTPRLVASVSNTAFPSLGTSKQDLERWFHANHYIRGAEVFQSEAGLKIGSSNRNTTSGKSWWQSRILTVRGDCVTQQFVYYKLGSNDTLSRAVRTHRSAC